MDPSLNRSKWTLERDCDIGVAHLFLMKQAKGRRQIRREVFHDYEKFLLKRASRLEMLPS